MAWTNPGVVGFNFRASTGYVTDGTDETYVLAANTGGGGGSDDYPKTRLGATFGWQNLSAFCVPVDRDSALDRRLAGINYIPTNNTGEFRVDLESPGTYDIRLANGDATSGQSQQVISIYDNTSLLYTYTKASATNAHFYDANGVDRTAAAWPGSNTLNTLTFATTTFILKLGSSTDSAVVIAHLSLVRVASSKSSHNTRNMGTVGIRYGVNRGFSTC